MIKQLPLMVLVLLFASGAVLYAAKNFFPTESEVSEKTYVATTTTESVLKDSHLLRTSEEKSSSYLLSENFDVNTTIHQAARKDLSQSDVWWVNSGGLLVIENGIASTLIGRLPTGSTLQERYVGKAERTDGGFRPQNIFRLLTIEKWKDTSIELVFRVVGTDSTPSIERTASNGILLFGRYQDQDNLYYAGIRVDGYLMIKKKKDGEYKTLALQKVFDGTYDKEKTPNLIPQNKWMRLRAVYSNVRSELVDIEVSIDTDNDGEFDSETVVLDRGQFFGNFDTPYTQEGHAGIRTDFMDVEFSDYSITDLTTE